MTHTHDVKYKIAILLTGLCVFFTGIALPVGAATGESEVGISFSGGDLILVSADNITFEPGKLSAIDTEYDAAEAVEILVADNRSNLDGWQLTAELGIFTIGEDQVLQGATITVSQININQTNTNNNSSTPTVAPSLTLVAGSGNAAPVATAQSGRGGGGWTVTFNQADIELAVKADTAREGLATAAISWVITDSV